MNEELMPQPYRVDTETIPEKVNTSFAQVRNQLINAWRDGEADEVDTLIKLDSLYWQATRTDIMDITYTMMYLAQTSIEYCFEAGIAPERAADILRDQPLR